MPDILYGCFIGLSPSLGDSEVTHPLHMEHYSAFIFAYPADVAVSVQGGSPLPIVFPSVMER
jgi:hypothetical protein